LKKFYKKVLFLPDPLFYTYLKRRVIFFRNFNAQRFFLGSASNILNFQE